jgi:hypothetical protein
VDKVVALTELRALANAVPDFDAYTPTSRPHLEWLAKGSALVGSWNQIEGIGFNNCAEFLGAPITRPGNVGRLMAILHRAIAALEYEVPAMPAQAFGPGAIYDFFKAFRELLGSATTSVFVIDPYLDEQVFDAYITAVKPTVTVRLLARHQAAALKPAIAAFASQSKRSIEARKSAALHDRVVFVDSRSCWVLGQSIKDAAANKPTYLAPLTQDVADLKLADYEEIWNRATPI